MKKLMRMLGVSLFLLMGNEMIAMADVATYDHEILGEITGFALILIVIGIILLITIVGLVLRFVNQNRKK